jgi:hypothetical protein
MTVERKIPDVEQCLDIGGGVSSCGIKPGPEGLLSLMVSLVGRWPPFTIVNECCLGQLGSVHPLMLFRNKGMRKDHIQWSGEDVAVMSKYVISTFQVKSPNWPTVL